jgi:hypothetical protein
MWWLHSLLKKLGLGTSGAKAFTKKNRLIAALKALRHPKASFSANCSDRSAAAQQVNNYHHQRYHQQQVNQTAGDVQAKAQQPQNQQHSNNRPEHVNLLDSSLWCIFPLSLNASERLSTLQTKALGARSDQPTKRAHPL